MGQVMGHGSQALQPLSSSCCATAPPPSLGCLQAGLFPEDPDWSWAEFKQLRHGQRPGGMAVWNMRMPLSLSAFISSSFYFKNWVSFHLKSIVNCHFPETQGE